MFEIGQISTATKTEGLVIAFKVLATDTCPVEDTGTFQGYYSTNSTYRPYNVTYNAPVWTFQAGPLVSCPNSNLTLFVRDKGPWCMQVIQHYACCNRTVASIMCRDYYSNTQLSGVDSQEEYDFISANSLPIYQNVSGGPVGTINYSYAGVWVDGNRTTACSGVSTSPCNTITPDMSPAPADGIVLRFNSATDFGMDDTAYGNPTVGTTGCWKGYVCGIEPS